MNSNQNVEVPAPVDPALFAKSMNQFASGVTVITTTDAGVASGTTVSAVTALSTEPPMVLICLKRTGATHDAILRSRTFAVNILEADQGSIAARFASRVADKFDTVAHHPASNGVPLLDGGLAGIVCRVTETAPAGSHTVFFGHVVEVEFAEGAPLTYFGGKFGRFERGSETRAYRATREFILQRASHQDRPIDASAIADELGLETNYVDVALVALATESLVERNPDGGYQAAPMTPELITSLHAGRAAIESGIVETYLSTAPQARIDALVELGRTAVGLSDDLTRDVVDDFSRQQSAFHNGLVGLADSAQLTESYRRLDLTPFWVAHFDPQRWAQMPRNTPLSLLVDAVAERDAEKARAAITDIAVFFIESGKQLLPAP